jgi:hypothetical protein
MCGVGGWWPEASGKGRESRKSVVGVVYLDVNTSALKSLLNKHED